MQGLSTLCVACPFASVRPKDDSNLRCNSCISYRVCACSYKRTWVPAKALIAVHHVASHHTPAAVQGAHPF